MHTIFLAWILIKVLVSHLHAHLYWCTSFHLIMKTVFRYLIQTTCKLCEFSVFFFCSLLWQKWRKAFAEKKFLRTDSFRMISVLFEIMSMPVIVVVVRNKQQQLFTLSNFHIFYYKNYYGWYVLCIRVYNNVCERIFITYLCNRKHGKRTIPSLVYPNVITSNHNIIEPKNDDCFRSYRIACN